MLSMPHKHSHHTGNCALSGNLHPTGSSPLVFPATISVTGSVCWAELEWVWRALCECRRCYACVFGCNGTEFVLCANRSCVDVNGDLAEVIGKCQLTFTVVIAHGQPELYRDLRQLTVATVLPADLAYPRSPLAYLLSRFPAHDTSDGTPASMNAPPLPFMKKLTWCGKPGLPERANPLQPVRGCPWQTQGTEIVFVLSPVEPG